MKIIEELWILEKYWINIKIMDIEQTVDLIKKKNMNVEEIVDWNVKSW